jgi:hypothetical protein
MPTGQRETRPAPTRERGAEPAVWTDERPGGICDPATLFTASDAHTLGVDAAQQRQARPR